MPIYSVHGKDRPLAMAYNYVQLLYFAIGSYFLSVNLKHINFVMQMLCEASMMKTCLHECPTVTRNTAADGFGENLRNFLTAEAYYILNMERHYHFHQINGRSQSAARNGNKICGTQQYRSLYLQLNMLNA